MSSRGQQLVHPGGAVQHSNYSVLLLGVCKHDFNIVSWRPEHACQHVLNASRTIVRARVFFYFDLRGSHASSPDGASRRWGSALPSCRLQKRRFIRAGPEPRPPHPRVLLLRGPSRTSKLLLNEPVRLRASR